jgi:DNA polymerase III alpha subunit
MENNITSCRDAHKKNHKDKVTMHVVIDDIRLRKTSEKAKNPGQEFAYLNISDNSGALQNVVCWPETWDKAKNDGLTQDCVVCLYGYKDCYNGREQVVASDIVVIG